MAWFNKCTLPWVVVFAIFSLGFSSPTEAPYYHEVKALQGDGIYSLLRRYQLVQHQCNIERFQNLNKLSDAEPLISGRQYKLPVLIYKYNGKTIRSTLGIYDYEKAKRIQLYNEEMLSRRHRRYTYQSSQVLWVPYHELFCAAEKAPIEKKLDAAPVEVKKSGRFFEIFGEKHGNAPLIDNSLRGQVFYLVAGHGGPDPGAMSSRQNHKLCEDEYAYDVTLRLAKNLIQRGAIAYVITRDENDGIRDEYYLDCDNDEIVWGGHTIPLDQKKRLEQRAYVINQLYGKHKAQGVKIQRALMVHVDSRSANKRIDVFFYHHSASKQGKQLAKNMQRVLKKHYSKHRADGKYAGSVNSRNLYMLRETKPSSVYIELGNIRNAQDQRRFILHSNRQTLADWLFEGLTTGG